MLCHMIIPAAKPRDVMFDGLFVSPFVNLPVCCQLFVVGRIACLSDPDSYAGLSFYTPVRASQAIQVEG